MQRTLAGTKENITILILIFGEIVKYKFDFFLSTFHYVLSHNNTRKSFVQEKKNAFLFFYLRSPR